MKDIELRRRLDHPRERVWRALTDPAELGAWLMSNDFHPEKGHRFTFRTDPAPGFDGIVHCEVLQIIRPELLEITWKGGGLDTKVTFRLEDAPGGGTLISLRHSGFSGWSNFIPRLILGSGWAKLLGKKLPAHLQGVGSR
jgi:uncharacterized protein YndB with AHSA1/START domain